MGLPYNGRPKDNVVGDPLSRRASGYQGSPRHILDSTCDELPHRHHFLLVAGAARPHRDRARLRRTLADHREIRDLRQLTLANPVVERLARIHLGTKPGVAHPASDLFSRVVLSLTDWQHSHLLGSEPERERAGEVFHENGAEPFERTVDR